MPDNMFNEDYFLYALRKKKAQQDQFTNRCSFKQKQEQICLDFSHKFLKFDLHGLSSRIPYPGNGK